MESIGFALIGCGMIAATHAQALAAVPEARLIGAYDPHAPARDAFAAKWGGRAYESLEALLADGAVDVVNVCTPSGLHAGQAIAALQAGHHVMVEKPLALTPADCDRVAQAARASGRLCSVLSQLRFSDATLRVKAAMDAGQLGRVVEASASMKYARTPDYYAASGWRGTWAMDGGGALMNQGIHGIDLMRYLLGPVKTVSALCRTLRHAIEVEDTAVAVLEFTSGALGVIEGTTSVSPGSPRRFEICGTQGSIVLEEDAIVRWDVAGDSERGEGAAHSGFARPEAISAAGHARQFAEMIAAIRTGSGLRNDAAEAGQTVRLIDAIYEASRSGRVIELIGGDHA